jgi:DNA-binding NarL/FixJ family response regulator
MFRVLLVTDDAALSRNVRQFVLRVGPDAALTVCQPREDGVPAAVHAQPQLALLDMAVAEEPSLAQLRAIRAASPRTWIAVIARFDEIGSVRTVREAGANEVVPLLHYLARLRVLVPWLIVHVEGDASD